MSTTVEIGVAGAWVGGVGFTLAGAWLSWRRRGLHPLLLICISAISFSWIEAPYDWATYAQFDPTLPRMPSWWPVNMTWGGLPSSVPFGYIEYFVLPAILSVAVQRALTRRFGWRRPQTLLSTGLVVGYAWAFCFNGLYGVRTGLFYYGRVIPHLAVFGGTKDQYPLYDALAMGVQMMVFAYLLGRVDGEGRTVIEAWAVRVTRTRGQSVALSIVSVILLGNALYGSVFAPHVFTKLQGWVTQGPTGELFPGVPNQPLHGGTSSRGLF